MESKQGDNNGIGRSNGRPSTEKSVADQPYFKRPKSQTAPRARPRPPKPDGTCFINGGLMIVSVM